MNILMMTNTFSPHVGGVARSIERFARQYRYLGHHVKVVAPEFDGMEADERDVIRVPALRHFNHTDFSVMWPIPHQFHKFIDSFEPDIIHSHHPFLVGGAALRVAHSYGLPLVFTHHTRYEDYTHNVPGDSDWLKRFVGNLATHYANLCDRIFAPSESIAELLTARGVTVPISVVPTGVDLNQFSIGNGSRFRVLQGIPEDAFVIGHLGRLTEEKNMPFLFDSIVACMKRLERERDVRCLVVGSGPLEGEIKQLFENAELSHRLHMAGVLGETDLADAYHAMNVFAFASRTETQGMVLTEAMASGVPVVAIDAPGVREVLENSHNGYLLDQQDITLFSDALYKVFASEPDDYEKLVLGARSTATRFSMETTANTALELYSRLRNYDIAHRQVDYPVWVDALHVVESEWELARIAMRSVSDAFEKQQ